MITFLKLKNLALIEDAEVEFGPGFNVFTGETGAGKSVLLGGLLLALGGRAEKSLIRSGCERCEAMAQITVTGPMRDAIAAVMAENELDFSGDTLNFRRVITPSSVRNFINDSAVGAKILQNISSLLIDVHAANEHQSLHECSRQLELLDRYAGTGDETAACAGICAELRELEREQRQFESELPSALEAEHFKTVAEEISSLNPVPGEEEDLKARYNLAANAKEVLDTAAELNHELVDGENSISERMSGVYRKLGLFSRFCGESGGERLLESCAAAEEQLRELSDLISDIAAKVEIEPDEFERMERRLSEINTLKRRYGVPTLDRLIEIMAGAEDKLNAYRSGDEKRREFAARKAELEKQLYDAAKTLSGKRRAGAERFASEILAKLRVIGFPKAVLEVHFSEKQPDAGGMDMVDFYFSANSGEPARPLRKVASSGELSRLMLAIRNVLADNDSVESVIFDEIDANIGGETALQVGRELENLGRKRQILAISHLPQVAARAGNHYLIAKREAAGRTVSEVTVLDFESRVREIARMLGNTPGAVEHARQIFENR